MTFTFEDFMEHRGFPVLVGCAVALFTAFLVFIQNCTFGGNGCWPRFFRRIERKIIFRPIQRDCKKKLFLFGAELVATKPLLHLQRDVINCLNMSQGGMLGVCADFGQGKTTTVVGAALARWDGMPVRVLCISPFSPPRSSRQWYEKVIELAGVRSNIQSPSHAVNVICSALQNKRIRTQNTKRLPLVGGTAGSSVGVLPHWDYAMLVLDDFSPPELKRMDPGADVEDLKAALDENAYSFLHYLAHTVHGQGIVVVVSTSCKNVLRVIHEGINGGSKAKMTPSTSTYTGPDPADAVVAVHHEGLSWCVDERLHLFAKKFPALASDPEGYAMMEKLAKDNSRNLRSCCEQLWEQPLARPRRVPPTLRDIFCDYIGDPVKRILSCEPFMSDDYDDAAEGENNNGVVELNSYQSMV